MANKFIRAIKDLDFTAVKSILRTEPKWLEWQERDGKNALHYVCGVPMFTLPRNATVKERTILCGPVTTATGTFANKADASLQILKLLLSKGMDINSIHRIPEGDGYFPGTPLWYAYTRGRNEKLYTYLLKNGADPRHCMYAITWYDDTKAAARFKKHGVFVQMPGRNKGGSYFEDIDNLGGPDSPLLAAYAWKKWNIAEWLLRNRADPNAVDNRGATPLFHAVRRKYDPKYIKLLLKYGADPDRASKDGRTPRGLAARYRDKTILHLFS